MSGQCTPKVNATTSTEAPTSDLKCHKFAFYNLIKLTKVAETSTWDDRREHCSLKDNWVNSYNKFEDKLQERSTSARLSENSVSSAYISRDPQRIKITPRSRFLDCLSMCFWKCSPGCQQLPSRHQ